MQDLLEEDEDPRHWSPAVLPGSGSPTLPGCTQSSPCLRSAESASSKLHPLGRRAFCLASFFLLIP